jgi:hypothetical protein
MCKRVRNATFSLLPHQLAPYQRYTILSMVWAVLFLCRARESGSPYEDLFACLPHNCAATLSLVLSWCAKLRLAFQRAHATLGLLGYLLHHIQIEPSSHNADVVLAYFKAIIPMATGPPTKPRVANAMAPMLKEHCEKTRRHFLGTPSQERSHGKRASAGVSTRKGTAARP